MPEQRERLREAVFIRLDTGKSYRAIAAECGVGDKQLRNAFRQWSESGIEAQPQSAHDIRLPETKKGRPTILTVEEEQLIADTALYYINLRTPLTREDLRDLVQDVVRLLPTERQCEVRFKEGRPSKSWVKAFLKRHPEFVLRSAGLIEDKRVTALTVENVGEHIARVIAACKRFNITDPRYVLNLDESGISFKSCARVCRRRAIGLKREKCLATQVSTRNIDHVTLMGVVTASGHAFKPVVVYPGKQAHVRVVNGRTESLHTNLPPCYHFQREPAGVYSLVFLNWAKAFIEELDAWRERGQKVLIVYDGYKCHIQYRVLKLFRENNVVAISLPAHTSSELQPLDKTVFGPFKAAVQRLLTSAARVRTKLHAFDIARVISLACSQAFTMLNIQSGFQKTGLWDWAPGCPSVEALRGLPFFRSGGTSAMPTVEEIVERFSNRARTLLRDVDVTVRTTVTFHTQSGACVTADVVQEAYNEASRKQMEADERERQREIEKQLERERKEEEERERQRQRALQQEKRKRRLEYPESAAEIKRLEEMGVERKKRRDDFAGSRRMRRMRAAERSMQTSSKG